MISQPEPGELVTLHNSEVAVQLVLLVLTDNGCWANEEGGNYFHNKNDGVGWQKKNYHMQIMFQTNPFITLSLV